MAVERGSGRRRQAGQSLVEFAFMVPVVLSLLIIMREVNMVINAAIVNQRYTRSTMYFLFFNHRWYPEAKFTTGEDGNFMHRFWVGVDQEKQTGVTKKSPKAPVISVGRLPGSDESGGSLDTIEKRQKVRVRVTTFMCLPPFGNKVGASFSEGFSNGQGGLQQTTFLAPIQYRYCQD